MKIKKLLESFEKEAAQPKMDKVKKAFFESVKEFSNTSNEVYSSRKLRELAKRIDKISEMAEKITLSETDGWFDQVSVKRDMKSIKEASKIFAQTCNEISTLQQRLESAYEDVGTKLSKYYDLSEAMDPLGKEDGDIDNDGDEDESDEYLANRRKAISKAIKNEDNDLTEKKMVVGPNLHQVLGKLAKLTHIVDKNTHKAHVVAYKAVDKAIKLHDKHGE